MGFGIALDALIDRVLIEANDVSDVLVRVAGLAGVSQRPKPQVHHSLNIFLPYFLLLVGLADALFPAFGLQRGSGSLTQVSLVLLE